MKAEYSLPPNVIFERENGSRDEGPGTGIQDETPNPTLAHLEIEVIRFDASRGSGSDRGRKRSRKQQHQKHQECRKKKRHQQQHHPTTTSKSKSLALFLDYLRQCPAIEIVAACDDSTDHAYNGPTPPPAPTAPCPGAVTFRRPTLPLLRKYAANYGSDCHFEHKTKIYALYRHLEIGGPLEQVQQQQQLKVGHIRLRFKMLFAEPPPKGHAHGHALGHPPPGDPETPPPSPPQVMPLPLPLPAALLQDQQTAELMSDLRKRPPDQFADEMPAVGLRSGIGKPSIFHAVLVTFLHYFSWGLLTVPFIAKLSETFGDRAFLVDGLVFGIRGIMSFLTTPLMGALSDFRGRKVVMLLAVATTYSPIPFMVIRGWCFFVLVMLSGVFGNTYSASLAYVADVTHPQERSRGYGIMSATYGAGMALSPMLGNFLMNCFGTTPIMALSSVVGFLNILFIVFAVPESLVDQSMEEAPYPKPQDMEPLKEGTYEDEAPFQKLEGNPHSISDLIRVLSKLSKDRSLLAVYLICFLGMWPFAGVDSCVPAYLKLNMGFSYGEVSVLVAMVALFGITSNLLLGSIMRVLGAKWSIRLGLVLMMVQLLIFGFASRHWVLCLAGVLASMSTIIQAASSTVASLYAAPENQGAVLGVLTGIECLCDGLGPAVFGVLFYLFQDDSKNPHEAKPPIPVPFVVGALGVVVALFLTSFLKKETSSEKQRLYRIFNEEEEEAVEPLTGRSL